MDYTFNKTAEEKMIDVCVTQSLEQIKTNLQRGRRIIDLAFPIEIAGKVRRKIDEELKGNQFNWLVAYRGTNQFGKEVDFISKTIGNEKHFRLNYFGD